VLRLLSRLTGCGEGQPGDLDRIFFRLRIRTARLAREACRGGIARGRKLQDQGIARGRGYWGMAVGAKNARMNQARNARGKGKLGGGMEWRPPWTLITRAACPDRSWFNGLPPADAAGRCGTTEQGRDQLRANSVGCSSRSRNSGQALAIEEASRLAAHRPSEEIDSRNSADITAASRNQEEAFRVRYGGFLLSCSLPGVLEICWWVGRPVWSVHGVWLAGDEQVPASIKSPQMRMASA